jgi:hypothetical protein
MVANLDTAGTYLSTATAINNNSAANITLKLRKDKDVHVHHFTEIIFNIEQEVLAAPKRERSKMHPS